jgi:hypothetical protein
MSAALFVIVPSVTGSGCGSGDDSNSSTSGSSGAGSSSFNYVGTWNDVDQQLDQRINNTLIVTQNDDGTYNASLIYEDLKKDINMFDGDYAGGQETKDGVDFGQVDGVSLTVSPSIAYRGALSVILDASGNSDWNGETLVMLEMMVQ